MSELLLGDDPPPPKRRPRWVDSLGLAAIVLGMVAIGVLGDRGERDDTARMPPTTTSTVRSPRRVSYRSTTTTTVTLPGPVAVGRALPADTRTVLLIHNQGLSQVYDVDAGVVRPVLLQEAGYPSFPVPGGFLLGGRNELELLGIDAAETATFSVELRGSSWPIGVTSRGVWVQASSGVVEVGFDGRPTGQARTLPPSAYPAGVLDRGLVVGQYDSVTLLEHGGGRRSLGHGILWALGGDTVAVVSCELLACELRALDARSGDVRSEVALGADGGQLDGPGRISPDGRWLVYQSNSGQVRGLIAVDLDRGVLRAVPASGEVSAWTFGAEGAVVFAARNNELAAYDLDDRRWTTLPGVGVAGTTAMTATSR